MLKKNNGYLLLDCLFAMSILLVIVTLLYPSYLYLIESYESFQIQIAIQD